MLKFVIWTIGIALGIIIPFIMLETIFQTHILNKILQSIIITFIHALIAYFSIKIFHFFADEKT